MSTSLDPHAAAKLRRYVELLDTIDELIRDWLLSWAFQ